MAGVTQTAELDISPLAFHRPDHVRIDGNATILSTIDEAVVTLAIWQRPSPVPNPELGDWPVIRFACDNRAVAHRIAEALSATPGRDWHHALATDVQRLAQLYAAQTGEERVEVRIERVTGNGCWKFHADYVGLRLITTYCGQATQWLPQGVPDDADPRALSAGDVGLFKGRALAGDRAIIHRSPPIAGTGEDRLLLVIDAPWPEEDA